MGDGQLVASYADMQGLARALRHDCEEARGVAAAFRACFDVGDPTVGAALDQADAAWVAQVSMLAEATAGFGDVVGAGATAYQLTDGRAAADAGNLLSPR